MTTALTGSTPRVSGPLSSPPRFVGRLRPPCEPAVSSLRCSVLDVEPGLGSRLEAAELREATARCTAPALLVKSHPWAEPWPSARWRDCLGAVVVRGHLARRTILSGRFSLEIFGPGDIVQPWASEAEFEAAVTIAWSTFEPVEMALMDRRFQHAAATWPDFLAAIATHAMRRADRLAAHKSINQIPKLGERLDSLLTRLAQRFGTVGRAGLTIPFALSHQMLADLAGAQRPSVSHALARLQREQRLLRSASGLWLIPHNEPPFLPG